jgi:mRNA interferase RelE/StbE
MIPRRPIRTTEEIASSIRSLHPALKKRIHNALDLIRLQPEGGKPLQRAWEGYRSFRIGKFRIIYRVVSKEIEVVAVGPRHTIYEEASRLMEKQAGDNKQGKRAENQRH